MMTEQEKADALRMIQEDRLNPQANTPAEAVATGYFGSNAQDTGKFDWEDILAGGYSSANSALFGIPDIIVKSASSDTYKSLQDLRARNKAASVVGDVAGAFAPTGGGLFKAGSAGLKALSTGAKAVKAAGAAEKIAKGAELADKAADIIRGAKSVSGIKGGILQGGLAAAEQTLPRVLTGQETLGQGLGETALGAGAGAALKGVGMAVSRLPEAMKAAEKWGNKTIVKQANVTDRILRQQQKYLGKLEPEEYMKKLASFAEEHQLHRDPKLDALVAETKDMWRTIGDNFDASGYNLTDDFNALIKSGDIPDVLSRNPANGLQEVSDMAAKVDATSSFAKKREYLNDIIFDEKSSPDTKKIANELLKSIEEKAEQLSGLDVGEAKEAWKMMKPFEQADIKEEMSGKGAGLGGGKFLTQLAISGIGSGMGVGATIGATTTIKGVIDDPTNPNAWYKLLVTTLSGAAAGAVNKQVARLLAKAARRLPADEVAKIAEKLQGKDIVGALKIAKIEELPTAAGKLVAASITPEDERKPVAERVEATEAVVPDEAQQTAAWETNKKYAEKLNTAMYNYWSQNFADSMSYEDYVQQVYTMSNGFDPKITASFFFKAGKERDKFLRDYEKALQLKSINLEAAYSGKSANFFQNITDKDAVAIKRKGYQTLVDTVASLVTNEGDLPSENTKKTVEADLSLIMKQPVSSEEKNKMLYDLLRTKYGFSYDDLNNLGLI